MKTSAKFPMVGRRAFVARGCRVAAACLTVPVLSLLSGCNGESDDEPAGPFTVTVAELPLNRRVRLEQDRRAVEVVRTESGVTARSLLCTHQGCNVRWIENEQIYLCPCHDGKFDAEGKPIYGPPRDALRPLTVTMTPTEAVIDG
jgi:cytochrome b6-f complex iron-sulfur subunit